MSPIDRHRFVSDIIDGRCALHARLSTNSCGIGHGNSHHVVRTNSFMGIHANSGGANAHWNSRIERGHEKSDCISFRWKSNPKSPMSMTLKKKTCLNQEGNPSYQGPDAKSLDQQYQKM